MFIGWSVFNSKLDVFADANPNLPFVGLAVPSVASGALAGYGVEFFELGKMAAQTLVTEFFKNRRPLGQLPVHLPHVADMYISSSRAQHFNLTIPKGCRAKDAG